MPDAKSEQLDAFDEVVSCLYHFPVGKTFTLRELAVKYGGRVGDHTIERAIHCAAGIDLVGRARLPKKRSRREPIPWIRKRFDLPVTIEQLAARRSLPVRVVARALEGLRKSGYLRLTEKGYSRVA